MLNRNMFIYTIWPSSSILNYLRWSIGLPNYGSIICEIHWNLNWHHQIISDRPLHSFQMVTFEINVKFAIHSSVGPWSLLTLVRSGFLYLFLGGDGIYTFIFYFSKVGCSTEGKMKVCIFNEWIPDTDANTNILTYTVNSKISSKLSPTENKIGLHSISD